MFHFLETDIKRDMKREHRHLWIIQQMICVMNSNLKIVWKTKITFLLSKILLFFLEQKYILFSETYLFKISKNLITSAIFFLLRQKHRYALKKASNAALVKLTHWIVENDHAINYTIFSCKWFKHGQTSKIIWLSTTWLLIFRLEVANKKPLFTTKPASIRIEISC